MKLLDIRNLEVVFKTTTKPVHAVNGVSLHLDAGEILGVVGESGAGKSQITFAMVGLHSKNAKVSGQAYYEGTDLLELNEGELERIRATQIAMIFQNPMTALNPYLRISDQMAEILTFHKGMSRSQALMHCIHSLDAVQIPDAKNRLRMYPHEFSGGMRQRVLIAMALLCKPRILIADEPTTALDVTVQAQIVELLKNIRQEFGTAIILITHDLGLVAGMTDRIVVMYGGQVMESGTTESIFSSPDHPYTAALLDAVPRLDRDSDSLSVIAGDPLDVRDRWKGCPFEPRCEFRLPICLQTRPPIEIVNGRIRACHVDRNLIGK
ncbi:MAG: ATP-binding cassette domain-containing protein [Gammaproteobacteria bacterium]|nr:ATP-binding cassette domain-containing protein [Gammaproteobacteria bacterium]